MHDAHEFLKALTIVLCVAALTTFVFHRLRQPVVLGYLIAGLIVGPHVPIPLVADSAVVQSLSEFGVILLMFSLGLEFSIRKLVRVAPTAGLTAIAETSIMLLLGFLVGRLFGWTTLECMFTGAIVAISSTTIIAKAFEEHGVTGKLRETVVGVLIVEDLIAIILMATLTAIASGSGLSAGPLALMIVRLAAFLIGLVVIGLLLIPRIIRAINRDNRKETTLVASIGICFAIALLAQTSGYSVALGAFIAGVLVAESGEEKRIARLIEPVRDMFAAVFFVSVGMLIDPTLIPANWAPIVLLTLVVIFGKLFGVTVGSFLTGAGLRCSLQTGMSLTQIGEFSFIIAGLGLTLKATGEFLYPVAVVVSAATTLTTPWMIKSSGAVATWTDRKLPKPLQTFAVLYGSWIESLRSAPRSDSARLRIRRFLKLLLLDTMFLAGIIVFTASSFAGLTAFVTGHTGIAGSTSELLVIGCAVVLALPFLIGILRVSGKMVATLADMILPDGRSGTIDFALAPRRVLVLTIQIGTALLIGAPLIVLIQPFIPKWLGVELLLLIVVALWFGFWKSATNLQGHVRAGAEVIAEVLATQFRGNRPENRNDELEQVRKLLPGIGELSAIRLTTGSPVIGKTLSDLNLRGLTGATVLAILRGNQPAIFPGANDTLAEGDILALNGTRTAIAAALNLLKHGDTIRK